ncbi:DNA polymerase III subunit delta' [Shewanella sp.]|uniref:DNA polymerase III subunit delta' n=1 Tax=Shewanella sp. TaxID=50422 RepID=UPI0035636141
MASLPWLEPSIEQFQRLLQSSRMPHAVLVAVDTGLGARNMLDELAARALCTSLTPLGACGQCKSCQLYRAGNHPDFYPIEADGNQIKVDQIRALTGNLTTTAQQGGKRLATIYGAERMNHAAANALLKTLEEPGENTLILLHTDIPGQLLPTLKSRCQQLKFKAPDEQQINAWLVAQQLTTDAMWALPVAGGPLKLADYLHNNYITVLVQFRVDWLSSLSTGHLCASLRDIGEEQITDALKVLYIVLMDDVKRLSVINGLSAAKVASLSGEIMAVCHTLTTMPSVNYLALCHRIVSTYQRLKAE